MSDTIIIGRVQCTGDYRCAHHLRWPTRWFENMILMVPRILVARPIAKNVASPIPCGRTLSAHRRISKVSVTNSPSKNTDPVDITFKTRIVDEGPRKKAVNFSDDEMNARMVVRMTQTDVATNKLF